MFSSLAEVEDGLRTLMTDLDPAVVHGPDAVTALRRFSAIEKMAATGRMLMGKRIAETNAWKDSGKATAEHFLADIAGCSLTEAHRMLGTARKLTRLPDTEKAARNGQLSPTQTGDIADAATADPTAEGDLLDLAAQASASELREEARKRRHAATANDQQRHQRMRANRKLRTWTDHDGAPHLHWNHLPEAGAEIGAILDDYIQDQFHHARRTGGREHRDAYAADALIEALRDAAAYRRGDTITGDNADADENDLGDCVDTPADDPATTDVGPSPDTAAPCGPVDTETAPESQRSSADPARSDPGQPSKRRARARKRRRGADAKVIVVIDHAALIRGHTEAGETCTIAGIGAVPVASVQALLDDAFIAAVIKKGVDVTTVAHLGRSPTAHQDTAKQAEGIECSTLGCPNRHRLERDHRRPYRITRHTKLSELDYSCEHCHDLKTYNGYMLAPGTGKRPLLSPAEQTRWNHDHPHQPVDPPQTSYPNRPHPDRPSPTRPAADNPNEGRGNRSSRTRRTPPSEALTLDL